MDLGHPVLSNESIASIEQMNTPHAPQHVLSKALPGWHQPFETNLSRNLFQVLRWTRFQLFFSSPLDFLLSCNQSLKKSAVKAKDVSNAPIYLDVTPAATTIGALIAILPQGYVHMNVVKGMAGVTDANEFC